MLAKRTQLGYFYAGGPKIVLGSLGKTEKTKQNKQTNKKTQPTTPLMGEYYCVTKYPKLTF